jgi:Ca2+-binding RTX toxin-like protein
VPLSPFTSLRRWLASTPVRRPARRPKLGLALLEDRSVPAITTATFTGGVLTITADAASDIIEIGLVGTTQVKVFEGATQTEKAVVGGPVTVAALTSIVINAGDGNDTVIVSSKLKEPATINGGTGSDNLTGGGGHDTINTGTDAVGDTADGRNGNDTITGGAGADLLRGGAGNDSIVGGAGINALEGGAGNDTLQGGADIDNISGNAGNDSIVGGDGADHLRGDDNFGAAGKDTVVAGPGDDFASGGNGNDNLDGGDGNDRLEGGSGNDNLVGGPDVAGGPDADQLFGGAGNDTAMGGADDDQLFGEAGRDSLVGGAGMDTLSGGLNRDFFVGHGTSVGGTGVATDAANFDTYKDEFVPTKPIFGKAEPRDLATTELGIHDALAGFASIANAQADFNIAGRLRYLGSGDYLVKLGPSDPGGDDPNNPSGTGWVPVSFDGTWTDNDPRPNAQERFSAPSVATEMREFWSVLMHRAVVQSIAPGYDPFTYYSQADYENLDGIGAGPLTNPGEVLEELSGRAPAVVPAANDPGFTFADIQSMLKAPFWITVEAEAAPALSGIVANQAYAVTKAFTAGGQNYFTLYNPSGRDTANAGQTLDQNVAAGKDDGFITLREDEFYANFATAYVN